MKEIGLVAMNLMEMIEEHSPNAKVRDLAIIVELEEEGTLYIQNFFNTEHRHHQIGLLRCALELAEGRVPDDLESE
jgi:hypothetical protein